LQQRNKTLRLLTVGPVPGQPPAATRNRAAPGLFLESQVMQKKLRQLTRQIITAQEEERKKISRELHDEVVQTLVGINVELSALSKGTSVGLRAMKDENRPHPAAGGKFRGRGAPVRPRTAAGGAGRPRPDPGAPCVQQKPGGAEKIKIQMTAFGGVEALGSAKRTVLFRVAQEALTNVARHAHASPGSK
jgi:two-component system sensor histidine kinase DegS